VTVRRKRQAAVWFRGWTRVHLGPISAASTGAAPGKAIRGLVKPPDKDVWSAVAQGAPTSGLAGASGELRPGDVVPSTCQSVPDEFDRWAPAPPRCPRSALSRFTSSGYDDRAMIELNCAR
jgi:hypothetical protein